jgi:hypothetical protein
MKINPGAPRGPAIRLTEDVLKKIGLTCIWLDRVSVEQDRTRLAIRSIVGRRAEGEKVWFRDYKDAKRVLDACLSRCFEAERSRDGIIVKLPYEQVVGLVDVVGFSLGIVRIKDADAATTFDSIHRRIEKAMARMQHDGSMKSLNREYSELRAAKIEKQKVTKVTLENVPNVTSNVTFSKSKKGQSKVTIQGQSGDIRDIGDNSVPKYQEWLYERLKTAILECTDLVRLGFVSRRIDN